MELFERVVLLKDLAGTRFIKGDLDTIVEIYDNGNGYEIEFFAADGSTLSFETVSADAIQLCKGIKGVLHLYALAA